MAATTVKAQNPYDLPMACMNTQEKYWVKGFNGKSEFNWQLFYHHDDGVTVTDVTSLYLSSWNSNSDTVLISWPSDVTLGGWYSFTVVETSELNCDGEPYSQDIILNTSTINVPLDFVTEFFKVCRGETQVLAPGDFQSYLWSIDNSTASTYVTGEEGTYQVQLVNEDYSCSYHNISLDVVERPEVWLGNDTVLFGTQQLTLPALVGGAVTDYAWSTGSNASTLTVDGTMGRQTIILTVNDGECTNSDTIEISSADYSNLRIPAAFTPNGDGRNDTWIFPAPQAENNFEEFNLYEYLNDVEVQVFNRWGKRVWVSSGSFKAWDGKDLNGRQLPMDSYHYIIRINVDDKSFTYKGSVTIIR